MRLYKTADGMVIEADDVCFQLPTQDWDNYINRDDLYERMKEDIATLKPVGDLEWLQKQTILAPIGSQEVWAAGVTYMRSKEARMEESKGSGGDTFYDKVYAAERPELFFKATASRTVGDGGYVRIRKDSTWDVPEPELTLFITTSGKIVAYTIGNDMSSRSIEGENPLYLPQAKLYDNCAGLGPCLYVSEQPISPDTNITLEIHRNNELIFNGNIQISQMKRTHEELAHYLMRELSFPTGTFLMTGTCIVPDHPFTLQTGDEIFISIDSIGTLKNIVA